MRQNSAFALPTHTTDRPTIISEFRSNGQQFLIVCLDDDLPPNLCSNEVADPLETYVEVDRFHVQGQLCAIVKVEQPAPVEINPLTLLTERELQIATLVASGQVNKQIAQQLRISEWTVSTHLRRIFVKLGVDSRAAMVYRCAAIIQPLSTNSDGM